MRILAWPVKTDADKDRYKVDKTTIGTTIKRLRSLTAPSSFLSHCQDRRFRGAERHTRTLKRVHLTQYAASLQVSDLD